MNELFAESEMTSLSPRLKWMQEHGITTREDEAMPSNERWLACGGGKVERGRTEEDALLELAVSIGISHWSHKVDK